MKRYLIYSSIMLVLLSGCGGGDDGNGGNGGNGGSGNGAITIFTQYIMRVYNPQKEMKLSLDSYVELSSPASDLKLKDIHQIGQESSPYYCSNYSSDALSISIEPAGETGECIYEYSMEAAGVISESALIRVGFSRVETGAVRLSATTSLGELVSINIADSIPSGYYMDKQSIVLLGSGTAAPSDLANVIDYSAGKNADDAGISRIIFNFKNDTDASVILATIDVSVSEDTTNHSPLAFNFRYGNPSSFHAGSQLENINVPLGESVVIDISPYFNAGYLDSKGNKIEMKNAKGEYFYDENDNKINFFMTADDTTTTDVYSAGLRLIDPDKHPLQLIDVYSYNATASPVQVGDDFTSTKFSFKSSIPGLNYVTYVLSDHFGGYATGIIEINVGVPAPWKAQLRTAKVVYFAPLEYSNVLQQNISHAGSSLEDGVNGPEGFSTALYTYNQAVTLCASYGLELPTDADIAALKTDFPSGLYSSLDKFSVDADAKLEKVSWPASSYYWAKSAATGASNVYSMADYNSRSVTITNEDERFAATCIAKGVVQSVTIEKNNAYRLPYSLGDGAVVMVKVADNQGAPISGVKVLTSVDSYTLSNATNNGITNANGEARFTISSIIARDNTPLRFTVGLSSMSNEAVKFLDLPRYVRTGTWRDDGSKPYAPLCFYDTIQLMAEGDCSKATLKRDGLWWGASYDSYFVDKFYVYRIESTDLYRARSFSGAANPKVMPASEYYGKYSLSRSDTYRSFNPILYDGKYYWLVNEKQKRVEAYSKIDDMVKQVNMVKSATMVGSVNLAFVYDQISGLYWRTTGVWVGQFDNLRSYKTIEDAASMINFIDEVPFYNLGGNNTTSQHKFAIFN